MRVTRSRLGLALLMSLSAMSGAAAGEHYLNFVDDGYIDGSYAREAIGGAYVGAPYTRFPRPSEIVPPAWGYGTFGVPTITGIRQTPAGAPTLTVIDSAGPAMRPSSGSSRNGFRRTAGRYSDDRRAPDVQRSGVRVISVTVPSH